MRKKGKNTSSNPEETNRTDHPFYKIMKLYPDFIFRLFDLPPEEAEEYIFSAPVLKETKGSNPGTEKSGTGTK